MKLNVVITILIIFTMQTNMTTPKVYGVVLAGGVGERLWPLSRQNRPKQFLTLSNKTLLEQAVDRLKPVTDQTWVVTGENHYDLIQEVVGGSINRIVTEPCGRNTGPAILFTCLQLLEEDPDAIVVFVPADPFIPTSNYKEFYDALTNSILYSQEHDSIQLFGIKPSYAATGYGYIEYLEEQKASTFFSINRFHEKPTLKLAQQYIVRPNMLWNIGMFCAKVSVLIDQFERWAPSLYDSMNKYKSKEIPYNQIESISIDHAVIEKSNHIFVQPVKFSWCDVGNIDIFLSLKNNVQKVKPIMINASNNLIDVPNKLVAIIGVDDLCVVETNDALLITKRSEAEKVRAVVKELKNSNKQEYI